MPNVVDLNTASHYQWGNQCDSWVLADTEHLSVKQEQMPPGTREQRHLHTHAQQFFFVLYGTATFYLNEAMYQLAAGQGILVPPASRHYIANETGAPLGFLVVSQPGTRNDRTNLL